MLHRLTDYLLAHAELQPNVLAAREGDRELTYRELAARVAAWQQLLWRGGVRPGHRVAALVPPGLDFYANMLATIGLGAIWVGLNPRYRYDEIAYVAQDARPTLIFYASELEGRSYRAEFDRLELQTGLRAIAFEDVLLDLSGSDDRELVSARDAVKPLDPAVIVYTSGSSGAPKGAILSHFGFIHAAHAQLRRWNVSRVDQICSFPVNHVSGVGDISANTLVAGGTLTFHERFDPARMLADIRLGRATVLLAVPTMIQLMMAQPGFDPVDLACLEFIVWGGAPLPRHDIERLQSCGPRLATLYGMTEATANTLYTREGAGLEELCETVGVPLAEFPTRLAADGKTCGIGEPGEVQHKGMFMTLGYYNHPEATAAAFTEDGWYRSGDLGVWRDDGNIRLVGRLKEMFKSGGYNVYPREIETVLEQHGDVTAAVVVAVSDPLYQEVGAAFVQTNRDAQPAEEDLRAFCRARLANYKIPKRFFIRGALPLLPVGKIDRARLRAEATELCQSPAQCNQ